MLRIYPVILETITALRPVLAQLERRDPDLARQLRRASASVALNVAEGMYSRGKNRIARYHTALGSMRETTAGVEVAVAMGYLREISPDLADRMNHVTGTLVRLVEGHSSS
jgi:four helix bundle protein